MSITIYHNPACGTSRNTLAMIRGTGTEPEIILYLDTPPTTDELATMIAEAGISVRDAIRTKQPEYLAHGLDDPNLSDHELLARMVATPILINRPFVKTPHGTRLCPRPRWCSISSPRPKLSPLPKKMVRLSSIKMATASRGN